MSTDFKQQVKRDDGKQNLKPTDDSKSVSVTDVEPTFTDYRAQKGIPYSVEYFGLGNFWDEGGVYEGEVSSIESYLNAKIQSGELSNSIDAIKNELKGIEKITGVKDEDRKSIKIGTIKAYLDFLQNKKQIRKDFAKYGQ